MDLSPAASPLGKQTSQFFANVYANPMDHLMIRNLHPAACAADRDGSLREQRWINRIKLFNVIQDSGIVFSPSLYTWIGMRVFTLGLAKTRTPITLTSLYRPPSSATVPGLIHAECLTPMLLGSPILSPERIQLRKLVMFAAWESEDAVDEFMATSRLGQAIIAGWHMRMTFLRRWGSVRELAYLPESVGESDPQAPVAAFTLARMKFWEIPRFVHWGRPVEALVRDNPEASFSLAAIRHPMTVATFSIWNSQQAMIDMVRGQSTVAQPNRHFTAMKERERRDFHFEFTTLRFRPLAEFGTWEGRSSLLPKETHE